MLILDEPTNHLDMQSVEMLTSALTEYPATVVFVSHNEYLISRVANRVVEIRPGIVRDFRHHFPIPLLSGGRIHEIGRNCNRWKKIRRHG